jgi:hypothetical protein
MNRLLAALVAVLLAPLAGAQEPAAQEPAAAQEQAAQADPFDGSAIQGRVESVAEQLAETRTDVAGLKRLKLSGYVQPRWAWQEAVSYNRAANTITNGVAAPTAPAQNGFFLRRGRFKATYDADWSQFVLQLDAIPSGVSIKEGFASIKLPWAGFAVDAGLQLFPFGYEVGVRSSADLDLLERSGVVRAFLAGEYDLGVAVKGLYGPLNFKVGVFNGNGVDARTGGADNDQRKDIIGRVGLDLGVLTGGVSGWYGKTVEYFQRTGVADDVEYDRYRVGADAQLYLDLLPFGGTAVKGEYIWGRTTIGSANGGVGGNLGRTGSGWYGLVTQNVGPWNQLAVRYEEYSPIHAVNLAGATNTTVAVQQSVQAALHTFVGEAHKLSVAWFHPMNGRSGAAAPGDPQADQLIVQAQTKF